MNLGSGPPAPLPLSVSLAPRSPYPPPIITVSLSFSVGSHKDTNAGQSDPKQMRKVDPSGGTILSNETQIKRSQTSDPNG